PAPAPRAQNDRRLPREPTIGRQLRCSARLAPQPSVDYALFSALALQDCQIAVELPLRQLDPVVVPLLALDLDVALVDVIAERPLHQLRAGELLDRLAERARESDDPALVPFRR